jgi:hypothetical protein
MALAVTERHCECVLATPHKSDQFYVVVGALREASRKTRITVRTEVADGPEVAPLDHGAADRAWQSGMAETRLATQRSRRTAVAGFPPLPAPPRRKTFHLFTGARDLGNRANYQAVHAELRAVGKLAQVYVDQDDIQVAEIANTITEVVRAFDEDIGPGARELGEVFDVDRDGRFTILLTRKLAALGAGASAVDGFVRASDFFRDLPSPFSNHCDMLYLNANVKPGAHLWTVLAHEYTHAVTLCEHARALAPDGTAGRDEESWLNEGLAHIGENPEKRGWSNLDYRISAYLAEPERYPLVVPDYFAAGLWRDPGTRGATFLFLRSCEAGPAADLTRRIIQSPLQGVANLEAATQKPFLQLFRQAGLACLERRNYGYLSADAAGPLLCGPNAHIVPLSAGHAQALAAGTATAFFLLHTPAGDYARIRVDSDGPVQVTVLRLPVDLPRLSLKWVGAGDELRLQVTVHHAAIWLRGADWQMPVGSQVWPARTPSPFGSVRLEAGASIVSEVLKKPHQEEGAALLFKVYGEDVHSRPVAAWISTKEQ